MDIRKLFTSFAAGLMLAALPLAIVHAAGDGGTGSGCGGGGAAGNYDGDDQNLIAGRRAFDAGDWLGATEDFAQAIESGADNADTYNLLAYSYRRLGQLDLAFANYARALELNPRHRGAHEYIGEAYLLVGNPTEAAAHFSALKEICGNCNEAMKLRKALKRYAQTAQSSMLLPDGEAW